MSQYTLYTKPNCSLCETTKQLLSKNNISYHEIVIGQDISREDVLKRFPTAKIAPIIVLDGQMIQTEALKMLLEANSNQQLLLERNE